MAAESLDKTKNKTPRNMAPNVGHVFLGKYYMV